MPWTLTTPKVSAHGDLDTVLVTGSIIDNLNERVRITYQVGKIENSEFVGYEFADHDVWNTPEVKDLQGNVITPKGTDFTVFVTQNPDGAKSYYENLKTLFYDRLESDGKIGAGTIS
jgi:hypothetical protein